MLVLVTRPEPEASTTSARLTELGHRPVKAPLFAAECLPAPEGLATPEGLLVTSRNGVRALAAWPVAAGWRELPLFAIGDATAAAARRAGFRHVSSARGDGVDLARLVAASMAAGARLLYAAAEERAPVLEAGLAAEHHSVETVVAYRMAPIAAMPEEAAAALAAGEVGGVLLYSARAARQFSLLAGGPGFAEGISRASLYALSPTVAEAAAGLKPAALRVAARPDEATLLAMLPKP